MLTLEGRQRISEAAKGNTIWRGRKHSEASREKMRAGRAKLFPTLSPLIKEYPREYRLFNDAKVRCNPGHKYHGDRGIKFLFTSFEQFIAEIGRRPSPQHSLDRFPNKNGNYEPGNVRWATSSQQNKNRRRMACLQSFSTSELLQELKSRFAVTEQGSNGRAEQDSPQNPSGADGSEGGSSAYEPLEAFFSEQEISL
jgi:NUMOD3 motif